LFTFQAQDFDEEAPICMAEREPCGFYSFSLDGKAPLKWIKSWYVWVWMAFDAKQS
jgi:hypothetical protein